MYTCACTGMYVYILYIYLMINNPLLRARVWSVEYRDTYLSMMLYAECTTTSADGR